MSRTDFLVIGAGIAGASAAYFLAERGHVLLLERESHPGYHSTGRSAALYSQTYGNEAIRRLTVGSERFYRDPPAGFADHPLLTPRGALYIGRADQAMTVERIIAAAQALVPTVRMIPVAEARRLVPALKADYVAAAGIEPDAMDIDVHALHQGFLRGLRARGGRVVTDAEVRGVGRANGDWSVETNEGAFRAPVLLNAAGAWCDAIAAMAGVPPIGLTPKRRTAFIFPPPPETDIAGWPMVIDADEQFYVKPDAGKLLGSPADETPVEPQDVQPDELDIAVAADRIQTAFDFEIRRIERRWAGLRSFVADRRPVVGFDAAAPGFFWVAGQGGYGIQTAPAMGLLCAALATGGAVPAELADLGLAAADLSPDRLR